MTKPILSSRSDEPEVTEAIEAFIVGLAERVDELQDAEFKGDLQDLAILAHKLGTIANELGFELLAASASDLERCCLKDGVDQVRDTLIDLTEIAKRVRMGHRGAV
jgi:HPt (histidine-containing phosphotransfer) domain-containing protein